MKVNCVIAAVLTYIYKCEKYEGQSSVFKNKNALGPFFYHIYPTMIDKLFHNFQAPGFESRINTYKMIDILKDRIRAAVVRSISLSVCMYKTDVSMAVSYSV